MSKERRAEVTQGEAEAERLSAEAFFPHDSRGRVSWASLRNDPEALGQAVEVFARAYVAQGRELTFASLAEAGLAQMARGIHTNYPGGIAGVRQSIGVVDERPRGYQQNPVLIEQAARDFLAQEGELTQAALRRHDRYSLIHAIRRHYPGGLREMKMKLGVEEHVAPPVEWTVERIEEAAKLFYQGEGVLSQRLLERSGQSSLSRAITRLYPGGFYQLKVQLGIDKNNKPRGYWTPESIEREAAAFYAQTGTFRLVTLREHNRHALTRAIHLYYPGGIRALRERLGLEAVRKEDGYWTAETIEAEAREFLQQYGGVSSSLLRSHGRQDLLHMIGHMYPGGMHALRGMLGINTVSRENHYWTKEQIEQEVRRIYVENGRISHTLLRAVGQSGLGAAITKHYPGQMAGIKQFLGITEYAKPRGYWTIAQIEAEASRFLQETGKLTHSALENRGRNDLYTMIMQRYPGKLKVLQEKLGVGKRIEGNHQISPQDANSELLQFLEVEDE